MELKTQMSAIHTEVGGFQIVLIPFFEDAKAKREIDWQDTLEKEKKDKEKKEKVWVDKLGKDKNDREEREKIRLHQRQMVEFETKEMAEG